MQFSVIQLLFVPELRAVSSRREGGRNAGKEGGTEGGMEGGKTAVES